MASHPVLFSTSTPHVLPPSKYLIPATWARYQLSQLINKVLALPQPIPFDFLVRGEILRGTLQEWCTERGVKEEETLEIEYFESLMPPRFLASLPIEEWVASVSVQQPGRMLAASYDSTVRVFNSSQKLLCTSSGHSGPVTSSCWVPGASGGTQLIASASHDLTGQISSITTADDDSATSSVLATLHLHTAPLSSIASSSSGSHVITASWDSLVGLFTTEIPDVDEVPEEQVLDRKKRRKVATEQKQPKRKAPVHVLKSHTARVSRALFSNTNTSSSRAYSCGFDSTIRAWDTELGVCTSTIVANEKPMVDLALTADGNTALGASTDRTVCIFDLRTSNQMTGPPPSLPHPALPSSLAAHPSDSNKVLSGSYDGIVRIWDLRSIKSPVTTFEVSWAKKPVAGKGKKILGVDWGQGILGVAGEGGVEMWRVSDGGETVSQIVES